MTKIFFFFWKLIIFKWDLHIKLGGHIELRKYRSGWRSRSWERIKRRMPQAIPERYDLIWFRQSLKIVKLMSYFECIRKCVFFWDLVTHLLKSWNSLLIQIKFTNWIFIKLNLFQKVEIEEEEEDEEEVQSKYLNH